jgi:hypothetical protein
MHRTQDRAAINSPRLKTGTAPPRVATSGSGKDESGWQATFTNNSTARRPVASSLKLAPIRSDERVFAGWLTSGEDAALSQWGRG